MKLPNFVIGKKQIILACLTLILGIAIYVNYVLSSVPSGELKPTSKINGDGATYNESIFVGGQSATSDYFAQCRIDRQTARDKAIETLNSVYNGGDATENDKAVVSQKVSAMSQLVEQESKVENLIKAAGFADCVVYLDGTTANIVVKSEDLIPSQAAQIKNILLSQVQVANENIKILPVK